MKNKLLLSLAAMLIAAITFGQAPKKMSYQSVIRNAANALVANQQVGIRVQIIQGTESGPAKYIETHTVTTNANGLATLEIGTGTVLVKGDLSNINWTDGPYFIKTETDLNGGTSYSMTTVSEMMSVPYAMLADKANTAKNAENVLNAPTLNAAYHSGTYGNDRSITANEGAVLIRGNDGIEVTGQLGQGADIREYTFTGNSSKMYFNPKKAAFRIGYITNANWDVKNVGNYSFASGYNSLASGESSTAMGEVTIASGKYSFASGYETVASGLYSVAMGWNNKAIGSGSTALGVGTETIGSASFATGWQTSAIGEYSFASGFYSEAHGENSTAMGYQAKAYGLNSTAIGNNVWVSASNSASIGENNLISGKNSFAIGSMVDLKGNGSVYLADNSRTTTRDSRVSHNTFYGRFANGYYLYTDATSPTIGARLANGANSWSVISDSSLKENFAPVNGKDFLEKIANMKLTSWNYKGQDPEEFRHYGPMAQDFYNAFGNDKSGKIGNDTTIASADFAGVSFIAIQALIKENKELKEKVSKVNNEVVSLKSKNVENDAIVKAMENKIQTINEQNASTIKVLQTQLENLTTDLKEFKKYAMMQKEMMPVVVK